MATHLDLEEQEQIDQLKHFWKTWGTLITSVVVLVSGAVLGWNGYQWWQVRQATQAAALSDSVEAALRQADGGRAEQAFGDLKARFPSAMQTAQAALSLAKQQVDAGQLDSAKATLQWLADSGRDEGYKSIARLRLAALLMDKKDYDAALAALAVKHPPEFDAVVADRTGDILVAQGKAAEAAEAYRKAWSGLQEGVEYRRIVEVKLNALGVSVEPASAGAAGGRS
ncbi:tetratricopeptide repeat protein [Acidovorax lacteus]|uniref:Ancillary SecYEG translocon subunit n=1 Tax=Acidovorax lacteus TaxID=1924988 RepID=A0ABP8KWA1_9BURK